MRIITNREIKCESYSNAGGLDKAKLAAIAGTAATATIGTIAARASQKKTGVAADIKAVCGPKPLFGKDKKAQYQKCAQNYAMNNPTAAEKQGISPDGSKKWSTGLKIGVAAGAALVIGLVIYLVIKRKKK